LMLAGTVRVVGRLTDAVPDQIVTPEMARQLHDEALRTRGIAVGIVMDDWVAYPGKLMTRLATMGTTPYIMLADILYHARNRALSGWSLRSCVTMGRRSSARKLWDARTAFEAEPVRPSWPGRRRRPMCSPGQGV
jgi:hypothetical protein